MTEHDSNQTIVSSTLISFSKTGVTLTTHLSKLGEKPDFMIDLEGSNFSAVRESQREERQHK